MVGRLHDIGKLEIRTFIYHLNMFQFVISVGVARLQWVGLGGGRIAPKRNEKWASLFVRKLNIDINRHLFPL